MPSKIPYDPSLVLGNLVVPEKLDNLVAISKIMAPVDAAEEKLNSLISLKKSIDMTIQELIDMSIDPKDLIKDGASIETQIKDAAIAFAKIKIQAEKSVQPLKAKMHTISRQVESPIDYNQSKIIQLPISSDSLNMNCQFFTFDENSESSTSHASQISSFVGAALSGMGRQVSTRAKGAIQGQVSSQHTQHRISGTLVISIVCTHKQASVFVPFIIDVDKGIRAWNAIYPNDMIKTNSFSNMTAIEMRSSTQQEQALTLLSGATYGSCFVGMVHVLNVSDTQSSQAMHSTAESLQAAMEVGGWFAEYKGSFGVDNSFSEDVKNLLSAQNISSHCTLYSLGSIPSIKSNQVKMAVKSFADIDPAKTMEKLAALQNNTVGASNTIASAALSAKVGAQANSIEDHKVQSVLSGLAKIDNDNNKMIDVVSLMDAMENYIEKCLKGDMGVPINFYTKQITKSQLAQMWLAKYYPTKYNRAGSGDDSHAISKKGSANTGSNTAAEAPEPEVTVGTGTGT